MNLSDKIGKLKEGYKMLLFYNQKGGTKFWVK